MTRPLLLLLLLLGLAAPAARAAPDPEEKEALRLERYALNEVKKQLWNLAKAASKAGNDEEARRQLQLGKEVDPADVKLHKQWVKLLARTGEALLDAEYQAKKKAVHDDCSRLLAQVALKFRAARMAKRARRYRELVALRFPSPKAAQKLGLAYYSPYLRWFPESHVRRLRKGWERHENRWLKPDDVRRMNGIHGQMSNPWVLYSEGFRLTTNLNLRAAKRFLAYAEAYRRWFLDRFDARGWDLRVPKTGLLPVTVTRRFEEFEAEFRRIRPNSAGKSWTNRVMPSGLYCYSTRQVPSPCLMSLELSPQERAKFKGKDVREGKIRRILPTLTHELSHQFAFEYSRHLLPRRGATMRGPGHWVVEGLATFLGSHVFDGERWSLSGSKRMSRILTKLRRRASKLPELAELFVMEQGQFQEPAFRGENYRMAAAAVLFLNYGAKGKHRPSLYKLLHSVHGGKTGLEVFADCFPKVDLDQLNATWMKFLTGATIPIGDGRALRFKGTASGPSKPAPGR